MIKRRRRKNGYNEPKIGFPNIEINGKLKRDIIGIFFFALAAIIILSFFNMAGSLGGGINKITKLFFGFGYILFPAILVFWGWKFVKADEEENVDLYKASSSGAALMFVSIISFLHTFYPVQEMFSFAKQGSGDGGGYVGAVFAWAFVSMLGKAGAIVIIFMMLLVALLITFNISFLEFLKKVIPSKEKGENVKEEKKNIKIEEVEDIKINISGQELKKQGILSSIAGKFKKEEKPPEFSIKPIEKGKEEKNAKENKQEEKIDSSFENMNLEEKNAQQPTAKIKKAWRLPPVNILNGMDSEPTSGDIKANSNIIKRTLANFGIQVEMGEVNVGPTVTQYTLKPAEGIKLSRITSLQNDLALALAARSIRIEAPILGKSFAGIEIPNQSVAMVRLKNILNSKEFHNRKSNLSIILGRDVAGMPIISDIGRMPHLMIAGATGSGKTVSINTLIVGLLFQNSPETLKFIMVDPKRVELTSYNDIPHLLSPVITDPDKAINALKWSISEMENRYELLSHLGCRNIESYNNAVKMEYKQREILPYIIIVIDELADLMATHGREMEAAVVRLAQMARAVGIHLVLSTQRPSVEVITGLIKANITTRIAFQVASQIDSRTILDMSGAEKLLGFGDMLYLSGDSNKPKRIQGVFISEEEVKKMVDFLKGQNEGSNEYNEAITENKKEKLDFDSNEESEGEDSRFCEAVEIVKEAEKASASLLQRKMKIGYARAARLLDLMEDKGIIGPQDGAKPREVYFDENIKKDSEAIDSGL